MGGIVPLDSCFVATVDDATKTATITGYLCDDTNIRIPETISSYTVNTYSVVENPTDEAIANCEAAYTKFGLPTYTSLCSGGTDSNGNTLESMVTSETYRDAYGALMRDTGIVNVETEVINLSEPYTVTSLGRNSFRGTELTGVILPNTITTIGNYAFGYTTLPSVSIPNSVTSIGSGAFRESNLRSVKLSENLANIPEYAFQDCKLEGNLVLGKKIGYVGTNAFYNNEITSVTFPHSLEVLYSAAFSSNKISEINWGTGMVTISNYAFADNQLTTLEIPEGVTTLGYNCFNINKLTSVKIPDTITSIPKSAFIANYLTSITIPDQITSIGDYAFSANNLEYVYIGENSKLTSIGQYAFRSDNTTFVSTYNGLTYSYNPNIKIYNNSGQSFDWQYAVNGTIGTAFEIGTVASYTDSEGIIFNSVTVTTGEPQ